MALPLKLTLIFATIAIAAYVLKRKPDVELFDLEDAWGV